MKQKINGVVTAKVVSEKPDELGRVKLEYQGIAEKSPISRPARIAVPMAGPKRGFQFLPEQGDEVLVAFKNGDENFPFVIGFLWNGNQKPPSQESNQRTLKTVSGHTLEFDDTEGSEKISLLFKGSLPGVTLSEEAITIKFSDQSYIELKGNELKIVNSTLVSINP